MYIDATMCSPPFRLLFAVVFLIFSSCLPLVANQSSSEQPPDSAASGPVTSGTKKGISASNHPTEAFVVEKLLTEISFENDGTETQHYLAQIQILSEAGVQHWGVISFSYQNFNQVLDIEYVRVRKPDGTVIVTPPESIQDITSQISRVAPFYTDQREKHVAVKGLSVGDVLEYAVGIRVTKPLVPGQFWTSYEFERDKAVTEEGLQISVPADRSVKIKNRGPDFVLATEDDRKIYKWKWSHPQGKTETKEDDGSQWKQARGLNEQPDVLLSSFKSWQEVGEWYSNLQQERVRPSSEIQAKAAEITKGLTSDDAKIQAIYAFVSTKFRYIGIALGVGRYQPHAASEVLENGYGDCKDKHTLLASLLTAAGYKAYPALISSEREIEPDVPSPGQFNHVITVVELPSGRIWLDTTPEVAPLGFLLSTLRGKHALVMPTGSPAALALTPETPPMKSSQTFTMKAKLEADGTLTGDAERVFSGSDDEVLLRAAFRNTPMPQWKDLVQSLSYGAGFMGEVSDVTASSPEEINRPFRISYKYSRKDYADWKDGYTSPPLPALYLPDIKEGKTAPSTPIWLGVPGEVQFHSELQLPKDYTLHDPSGLSAKEAFAEYQVKYVLRDGMLVTDRNLTILSPEVPVSAYEKYKAFRKKVDDDHDTNIALSHSGTPSVSASKSSTTPAANTANLFQEVWALPGSSDAVAAQYEADARNAFTQNDLASGVDSLRSAVEKDPKFTRGWLVLGTVLAQTGDRGGAIEAYRKGVAADPDQAIPYKLLGMALMADHKFEDAVPIWQKLIKLVPTDSDAQANLGSSLNELKQYDEAAAAIEAAVKLSPSNVGLRLMLGNTYLNTGDSTKARASFEEAIKLDSSTTILNDVAYSLADKNIDLDKAKEYAQKAVLGEEEASAQGNSDTITSADLDHTVKLAMFWDTLGWVYFRMNDLPEAEKYLKCAWSISQDTVVGEHLGQVYEKKHLKRLALHTYQLAFAAGPPIPEHSLLVDDIHRVGGTPDHYAGAGDLSQMRTIHLPRIVNGTAQAAFYIVMGPGHEVEAKFISGTESLKKAGKTIGAAKFNISLPDENSARAIMRGVVGCYPYSGCSLVMMTTAQMRGLRPPF